MKIVFMGTPEFSVPALKALTEDGHEVAVVVTQPDKPKGRGNEVQMPPVKEAALSMGIPVCQPEKARDPLFIEALTALAPDVIVVAAFGQLLPKAVLELPRLGCVNIHASLLPKYRGASPIQSAVLNGDAVSGITTMMMAEKMDTGDILEQETVPLDEKETSGSLHDKLSAAGAGLLLTTLRKLEEGTARRIPQDDGKATYVTKITKEMGEIDWTRDARSIERLIRGLNPWPSAYTLLDGKTLKIWEADVVSNNYKGVCGQVVEAGKDQLVIKTGQGALAIRKLQLQGRKRMDTGAFLRGCPIPAGTVFPFHKSRSERSV